MNTLLQTACRGVVACNRKIGRIAAGLLLVMVILQFFIVLLRYVFSFGSVWVTEIMVYLHGFVIMLGCAYTLIENGHVRIDVLLPKLSERTVNKIEFFGSALFMLPFAAVVLYYSFPFVVTSWRTLEGSIEAAGLPYLYILKTTMLFFAISMMLQAFVSMLTAAPKAFAAQSR